MQTKKEFYRAKLTIYSESYNKYRIYESNEVATATEMFNKMYTALQQQKVAYQWALTLEHHTAPNYCSIIKFYTASDKADSPLY
jgi:hypothetical protein